MELPNHIAERIRDWVARTPKESLHVDHEAARYGGISLLGTIGATWLMRPDGTLWDVDDDFGRPLQPLADRFHSTALVAGVDRHPWLAELLPSRPVDALDCRDCAGRGRIGPADDPSTFAYCSACGSLGWINVTTDAERRPTSR
jgi:hypothetical protein